MKESETEKYQDLLRAKWSELLGQKLELERRMNAINLLLDGKADANELALQAQDAADDAPKKKRGRRTNAQIAADNAAAAAAKADGEALDGEEAAE